MTPNTTPPEHASPGRKPAGLDAFAPPQTPRPHRGGRNILLAGVAGACVLGVGLGLWARPQMNERRVGAIAPEPEAIGADTGERKLKIVVDDHPAPVGAPIQVLPAAAKAPAAPIRLAAAQPAAVATAASAAPSQDLMRAQANASPAPPAVTPKPFIKPVIAKFAPLVLAALAEAKRAESRLMAPRPEVAEVKSEEVKPVAAPNIPRKASHSQSARQAQAAQLQAAHQAELAQAATARAAAQKAAAHRIELAQAARTAKAEKLRLAQAEKLEAARQAKADKLETIRLAKAEAKGRAEAHAEAKAEALAEAREEAKKQIRLASLVRTIKRVLPHDARPAAPAQTTQDERKHAQKTRRETQIEQASLKTRKVPHIVEPPNRSHVVTIAPPHPSGLMKVSTPRCAQRDPGEALVCADPSLGAADRQLLRAYQGARAAGVPDAQLERQQQRWLAARSAAAREAPWAVHDVYMARIAELNGMAHEAHADGY